MHQLPNPSVMRICFVRHGETDWNVENPIWGLLTPLNEMEGHHLLVISHGNALCGLVRYVGKLNAEAIEHLEIASGVPLVYRFSPKLGWESMEWLE